MEFEITNMEWKTFEELMEFLRPFNLLTEKMSGEEYITASKIIPAFNNLFDHFDRYLEHQSLILAFAAKQGFEKLKKYYSKTNMLTMMLTFLDPRYKMKYFQRQKFPQREIRDLEKL